MAQAELEEVMKHRVSATANEQTARLDLEAQAKLASEVRTHTYSVAWGAIRTQTTQLWVWENVLVKVAA